MGSGAPAVAWGEEGDRTHPRPGPRDWGLRGPGVAAGVEGEARPTRTRDDGEASAGVPAAGCGAAPVPAPQRWLSGVPVPPRLPRPASAAGRRGWAQDNGPGAREQSSPPARLPCAAWGRRGGGAPRGRRPPRPGGRRAGEVGGSGRTGRRRGLTLTKSSMMGSLSSSFNPFSGIDNAMAGSAGLRGRRRRLFLLRDCSGYGLPPRGSSLDCPGV